MIHIGYDEFRFIFICSPNNVVYKLLNAQFNETFFSKCPDNKGKLPCRLLLPGSDDSDDCQSNKGNDDFDNNDVPPTPRCHTHSKKKTSSSQPKFKVERQRDMD